MSIKRSKRKKMQRALALFLAILMIISAAGTLIYYLTMSIYAAEPEERLAVNAADDEMKVRIGLMYGSNVTVGFEVDAAGGFGINRVDRKSADLAETRLWELNITKISCVVDSNLAKTAMTYSKTTAADKTVIGGYHLEIGSGMERTECEGMIAALSESLTAIGIYAIPCYLNGGYSIRAGHFATADECHIMSAALSALIPDLEIKIAAPTDTAVAIVDPLTDTILFEYDDNDVTALGLEPLKNADGSANYLVTPAKKSYDGTFMFRRYNSTISPSADKIDGVSLTDVIKLGDYLKGVLPYEVNTSWQNEALKAFAITARSFTLSKLGCHESVYEIDLCNTTHCQVYNGRALIDEATIRAVDETSGLVMTYDNKIVQAYYSAVQGGVTVSSEDAWGGSIPYLQAVKTPWEIYTSHSRGTWTVEVTPSELANYLREKGYSQIKGNIADISIDQLAKNSTYVYKLTLTDTYGNKLTLTRTDTVRSALSKYLNSANFVVGRGSVEADITTFSTESLTSTNVITKSGIISIANEKEQYSASSSGVTKLTGVKGVSVMTKDGIGTPGKLVSKTERQLISASSPNNFIFVGTGWGHGVGISQIGLRDLAKQGYKAEEMLKMYLTGIEIKSYNQLYK